MLTVNRDKTKFMMISFNTQEVKPSLYIEQTPLMIVSNYEYLGMILDDKLNMSQQVDSMYKKADAYFV